MIRNKLVGFLGVASLAIAACDDPGTPSPTPDRVDPAATHTVREWPPPESTTTSTAEVAPTASATSSETTTTTATAEATASGASSAAPAPSGSASASPVVKGFALPASKTGILSAADADKVLKTGVRAKVRVLDAGKEPLAKLVLAPTKGASQPLRLDIDQKVSTVLNGQATEVSSPPQTLDVDMDTGDVDEATGALVTMTLKRISLKPVAGIDAASLAEVQKQLSGLNGYAVRERVSPFGDASDAKAELPKSAPQGAEVMITALNDIFRTMLPILPEEPVGPGAKWQALSREDHGGANVMVLTEYTLKERTESQATLNFTAKQVAVGDQFKLPIALPEGTTTRLTKFSSTVSGSLVIDPKQIAPIKGRSSQDTKVGIEVSRKGSADKLATDTSMKASVSFARRGGDAGAAPSSAPSAEPKKDAPTKP